MAEKKSSSFEDFIKNRQAEWSKNGPIVGKGSGTGQKIDPKVIKNLKPKISKTVANSTPNNAKNIPLKETTKGCTAFCRSEGMMILPLRYTVVSDSAPNLVSTLGQNVKDITLTHFKYGVEKIDTGYIYRLVKKKSGKVEWAGYNVTKNGYLSYFVVGKAVPSSVAEFACKSAGHNFNASMIVVENNPKDPALHAYIIHTHVPLSQKKIAEYEKNAETFAKDGKWQKFDVASWATGNNTQTHCLNGSQLSSIYNYVSSFGGRISAFSKNFKEQPKKYAAMALFDPIGITKKLNETRNAQFKELMNFLAKDKNQHKLESSQMVDSIELIMTKNAVKVRKDYSHQVVNDIIKLNYGMNKLPKNLTDGDAIQYEIDKIWDRAPQAEKDKYIKEYYVNDIYKGGAIENAKNDASTKWEQKYKNRIDWNAKNSFDTKINTLTERGKKLAEAYAQDHIQWIKSKALINALYAYDKTAVKIYGTLFYTHVMSIMNGMAGSDAGQKVMEDWLLQEKVTPNNLYLRAVLYNQTELIQKFEAAAPSVNGLDWDQQQSLAKDLIASIVAADTLWEEWLKTNDAIVERQGWPKLTKSVMFISETTRTAVKWSLKYNIDAQLSKGLARLSLLIYAHGSLLTTHVPKYSLLYNLDSKMSQAAKTLDATQIQKNWKKAQETIAAQNIEKVLKSSPTSISLRISAIVAFFELINFGSKGGKALNDPNWENSTAAIAGMFSLTAATLDIASGGMHALSFAEKAEKIKVYGASFAIAGSTFSFINDAIAFSKEKNSWVKFLLVIKLGVSFAMIAVGLGGIARLPILKSKITELGSKYIVAKVLVNINILKTAAVLNWVGVAVTIIIFVLEKYCIPNDLQIWCSKSIFGDAKDSEKYQTLEIEEKEFNEALQSI
ncbi:hypothetical protein B9T31_06245 [Acinetobacter sp. ANC 4558]|uniref:T6SS effector BTH_I2691 family protein n=1 Tax=Acinetobacter sp. ANC 4558 TaxID=1977876 RepID=UPI000A357BB1|nr:T6SS effector BTH_I2691 family protein [Acinetobacter sp. ANC 4558]OTG86602.1 hypothetical protein B9T31_06245 [Acinetobacter sp. ANC 4558]